ncbi:MAG: BACON domain-containing protein [Tannerellaceae bacterium]|nr:BACON domain-containing protein [Tannerellaceae bacterium]
MKKYLLLYPLLLFFPFLFVACEEDDDDDYYDYFENLIFPASYERYQDLYADDNGGVVHFEAKRNWTIEASYDNYNGYHTENWITVDKTSGQSGRITLRYTSEQNVTKEERSGYIVIYCGDDEASIYINQSSYNRDGTQPEIDLTEYGFVNFINMVYEGEYGRFDAGFEFEYENYDYYKISRIAYNSPINNIIVNLPYLGGSLYTSIDEELTTDTDFSFIQETGIWSATPFYRHTGEYVRSGYYTTHIEAYIDEGRTAPMLQQETYLGTFDNINFTVRRELRVDELYYEDYRNSQNPMDWENPWLDSWCRCDINVRGERLTTLDRTINPEGMEIKEQIAFAKFETNIPNSSKVNVDLNNIVHTDLYFGKVDGFRSPFSILGLYGKRNSYLVSASGDEITGREWSYDYKLNDNGFVEQVTVTNNYNDSKIVYTIQYLGQ